jgi:hypothetical protein
VEALQVLVCYLLVLDAACVPAGFGPPPVTLEDCRRFPDHATARANLALANAHLEWLRSIRTPTGVAERQVGNWKMEASYSQELWEAAEKATDESRLDALKMLKALRGPEDWYGGKLPPPVPVWRFRRLD